MEKKDFLDRITEIGSCDDDVKRRELLAQLSDEASKDYDTLTALTETNETLKNDNETLRDANMKLFLRVGEEKTDAERVKNETGVDGSKNEKRSFDDLFNEKGGIK